jgi:hypothetical protein
MLKRNGEPHDISVSDGLNRGETDAYNEALEGIQEELEALERITSAVRDMAEDPVIFTIPGGGSESGSIVQVGKAPSDRWQICSTLLKLRNSQVFLCERSGGGAKEYAVIERFRNDSAYAQANGDTEVLLAGADPVLLVEEYAASAEHTLRGMASNLVAKAHKIVWARYASTSPARVVQAIAEKCAQAASLEETESKGQFVSHHHQARSGIAFRP